MKYLKLTPLLLMLVFFSACNQKGKAVSSNGKEQEIVSKSNEGVLMRELNNRVKELYKWHETKSSDMDFDPLLLHDTDPVYAGLDLERHKQRMVELRETNLFTDRFLENYDKIALRIDEKLRNRSWVWYVGELPPFGNGANPWCNCQDNPDNFWGKIMLKDVIMGNDVATFNWSWGDGFSYKTKTVLVNGTWKIDDLEGFDVKSFLPAD